MSTVRHGGLAIDIPDGWADQSTLLFVAPRLEPNPRALHTELRPTETVSVRFVLGENLDAKELLAAQIDAMKVTDPDFAVVASGAFSSGLGAGWQQTQRITVGGVALKQLATATVIGPVAVLATATSSEARFPLVESALLATLSSMKAVRS